MRKYFSDEKIFFLVAINYFSVSPSPPVILLPDVSASLLLKLQDVLRLGFCDEVMDVQESSDLLDAMAALGLDIKKLHLGKERKGVGVTEVVVNIDNVRSSGKELSSDIARRQQEGSQVVLVKTSSSPAADSTEVDRLYREIDQLITDEASLRAVSQSLPASSPPPAATSGPQPPAPSQSPSPASAATSSSSTPSMVAVKTEKALEENDVETPTDVSPSEPGRTDSIKKENVGVSFQCEVQKCSKPFSEAKLLKYHYCSHFMSVLRKNYEHLLNSTNTCKECNKNFANSHKLLQHIGSFHDKIIDILKTRGYKAELPVHSSNNQRATLMTKTNTGKENDSVNSNVTVEVRKVVEVAETTAPRDSSETPLAGIVSSSAGKKTGGDPTRLESLLKKVTGPPPAGRRKSRQSGAGAGDTSRCNYELECQV